MDVRALDGLVATFRDDGSLLAETTYERGVRQGPYRDYWLNGQVSLEGQYVDGLQEGEWRFYNPDGGLREILHFKAGREVIDWEKFFQSMPSFQKQSGARPFEE